MNMDATDLFIINSVKDVMCNSSTIKERFKRDVILEQFNEKDYFQYVNEIRINSFIMEVSEEESVLDSVLASPSRPGGN